MDRRLISLDTTSILFPHDSVTDDMRMYVGWIAAFADSLPLKKPISASICLLFGEGLSLYRVVCVVSIVPHIFLRAG